MDKIKSFFDEVKNRLKIYHKSVNWFVFTFIVLFTIGSWIDINGMWCELPIMVHELPEGWRLPSVLTILTQASQIGPIIFLLLKWLCPNRVSFAFTIYIILGVGALSCLLLSFFWDKTIMIGNEKRSIGLYTLTFSLGLLDGTSSVTFLPYIGTNFKKEYVIPNYIGESLSAMIPSIAGIIQGVGQDMGCRNVSKAESSNNLTTDVYKTGANVSTSIDEALDDLEPIPLVPYFSVSIYYIILFILLCICTTSFTLLHFLPMSKRARKNNISSVSPHPDEVEHDKNDKKSYTFTNGASTTNIIDKSGKMENETNENNVDKNDIPVPTRNEQILLLGIILGVSFIAYGVLPGMQSYSTLPYGNNVFHLAINLSFVCLPIVIFLSIWSYKISAIRILIEFLIGVAFAIYIIVIAILSPCPPMLDNWFGPTIMVISWVVTQNMFMRVRCCVAARLEACGQRVLLLLGGCTMFGQMIGGVITFLCIDTYRLLKDVPSCTSIKQYCSAN